ncbi:MAG: hypothetical protein ACOCYE_09925 [Pseudomonadota bacterium]
MAKRRAPVNAAALEVTWKSYCEADMPVPASIRWDGSDRLPDFASVEAYLAAVDERIGATKQERDQSIQRLEDVVGAAKTSWAALQAAEAEFSETLRIVRKIEEQRQVFNQALWMRTDASQYQRMVLNHSFEGTPLGT